jgi:hypothetical protein
MMYPDESTGQSVKSFLNGFIQEKKLFPAPDENTQEVLTGRWPQNWDNKVKGVPSMEVNSPERRGNFMPDYV